MALMSDPSDLGSDPDDILSLIADVYAQAPAPQDRLEQALGTLESTHRHASAAMQRFERSGKTGLSGPTAAGAPALTSSFGPSTRADTPPQQDLEQGMQHAEPAGAQKPSGALTQTRFFKKPEPLAPAQQDAPAAFVTALPKPPQAAATAEVLSGRGAEFVERGHTKTHIIRPIKKIPKK